MVDSGTEGGIYPRGFEPTLHWPWPLVKAGRVIRLNYGRALREGDRRPGDIPVYGTNGRCGSHVRALTSGPGVILGRKGQGPLGVEWCDSDFWVIDTAYYATPINGSIDLRYFYYLVKYIGLNHLKDGTSNPSLSRDVFRDLLLPVPPVDVQRGIARNLRLLDEKIELNQKTNETLEVMAQSLFKSWFVDFDPVRAKAEGRDPCLPADLADLFPGSFEHSELGEIPTGWKVREMGTLCESITSGGTPSRKEPGFWLAGTIPWFKTGELLDRPLIDSDEHITNAGLTASSCKLWPAGTVLFALYASPTVGRIGVLTRPGTSNQAAAGLIAKQEYGVPFLRRLLITSRDRLQSIAVGAAQQNINQAVLRTHRVIVPPPTLASYYSKLIEPLDRRQVLVAEESNTLNGLRDTLLSKLISGELRLNGSRRSPAGVS